MMIKAVIFDLDDTLYNYDAINGKAMDYTIKWFCNETRVSEDEFQKAFVEGRVLTKKYIRDCASQHNRIIYFQKTLECLGFNPIKYSLELYEIYWEYMLNNMCLEKGADTLMQRLKESGIKIAICTDLTTHIQHRKLRKLLIADYIDVFVSSEEADAEKPDTKIFNLVISKLNVKPHEAIHVGDSYEKDVIGASNAGIIPVWFNPSKKPEARIGVKTVLNIESLRELERYIYGN